MNPTRKTRWGVVIFPGSNCDHDAIDVLGRICGQEVIPIWHRADRFEGVEGVIIPGGFSYGDYLRGGAIARFAPVVERVVEFAAQGGIVVGICNGFQILTELGLLPGVLMRNVNLRFVCTEVNLRVERTDTPFTRRYETDQVLKLPIAHNEGNYYLPAAQLKELESEDLVLFRYCDRHGAVSEEANPNGSAGGIAGIVNAQGNVLGIMPHPERRCDPLLGRPDGLPLFRSLIGHVSGNGG